MKSKNSATSFLIIGLHSLMLILICTLASAQISQTQRYERLEKNSNEYFSIISLKENGLALIRETDKFNGSKRKWEMILLDTSLIEKHTLEFEVEQRNSLVGFDVTNQLLHLLYRIGDTNKGDLQLISFHALKGEEVSTHELKPELDFKITHFNIVGEHLVLGGYVNNEPAVLLYTLADNQLKVLPGFFQKDTELVDLRVNQNQTFNTVLIDRSIRTDRKLIFKTFDETGKLLLETHASINEDVNLHTSISSALEREDLIILGTWGDRNSKQSNGFFSLPVDPFNEQKIQYTYFGSLTHFLDYQNPKRAKKIQEKTKLALQANKTPEFTTYVVPFKMEEYAEGFLLLAEVYSPTSTSSYNSNPYYNPYGYNPYGFHPYGYNPYWPGYYPGSRMYRPPYMYGNNVRSADEFKTHETVLLLFDPKGNIVWDHSLKLEDVSRTSLDQMGEFYYSKSDVILLYKKESDLTVKKINLATGESTVQTEKIKLNDPVEEIRSEKDESGLSRWYGNTFYTWGYQSIRNVLREDRTRSVFYINKIQAH